MSTFRELSLEQIVQIARKEKTEFIRAKVRLDAVTDELVSRMQPMTPWKTEGCRVTWVVRGERRTFDVELLASNLRAMGMSESQVQALISDSYEVEVGTSHWKTLIDPLPDV